MSTAIDVNKLVMELRAKTGAGMMDCKKALTEANNDFEAALTILRKKGLSDAAKKSGRVTKEGVVAFSIQGGVAAIVELNCETDFVARNESFVALGQTLADKYAKGELKTTDDSKDLVLPVFQKLSENMAVRRFDRLTVEGKGGVFGYAHKTDPTVGAKQGAIIELSGDADAELAKELLLQIVAAKPKYIKRDEVPTAEIDKEKEIYADILRKEGKPDASIPKIVEGKINKLFYQQLCLLEQMSVRDGKTPIVNSLKPGVTVKRFVRYQLGE